MEVAAPQEVIVVEIVIVVAVLIVVATLALLTVKLRPATVLYLAVGVVLVGIVGVPLAARSLGVDLGVQGMGIDAVPKFVTAFIALAVAGAGVVMFLVGVVRIALARRRRHEPPDHCPANR
jgi:hypothetical protein